MTVDELIEQGEQLLEKGDNEKAAECFESILEALDEDDPQPSFDKGRIATRWAVAIGRLGRTQEALEELDTLHEYFVDFVGEDYEDALWVLAARAEVKQLTGDRSGAAEDARAMWEAARQSELLYDHDREKAGQRAAARLKALGYAEEAEAILAAI